jgi:hypothetical protein
VDHSTGFFSQRDFCHESFLPLVQPRLGSISGLAWLDVCRPTASCVGLFNRQFKFQELDDDSGFAYIAKEKIGFAVGHGRRDPASVAELIFSTNCVLAK